MPCRLGRGFHQVGAIHELPLPGGTRIDRTFVSSSRNILMMNIKRFIGTGQPFQGG
jgi:hypothetical protein